MSNMFSHCHRTPPSSDGALMSILKRDNISVFLLLLRIPPSSYAFSNIGHCIWKPQNRNIDKEFREFFLGIFALPYLCELIYFHAACIDLFWSKIKITWKLLRGSFFFIKKYSFRLWASCLLTQGFKSNSVLLLLVVPAYYYPIDV